MNEIVLGSALVVFTIGICLWRRKRQVMDRARVSLIHLGDGLQLHGPYVS